MKETRANYDALLKSSEIVTKKLKKEAQDLRAQWATEYADRQEAEDKLADREKEIKRLETELSDLKTKPVAVPIENPEPKQNSVTARDLPDAFNFLNKLKAEFPKAKFTRSEAEKILRIIEES